MHCFVWHTTFFVTSVHVFFSMRHTTAMGGQRNRLLLKCIKRDAFIFDEICHNVEYIW